MPWYSRRTYSRYGRAYRRRIRRWFWRRRKGKNITSRGYATKQKLDVLSDINVTANQQNVNVGAFIHQILPAAEGWNSLSAMYTSFRITFIKVELNVSRPSNADNQRQQILFTFWPGLLAGNRSLQQINSSNIRGYASYGNAKSKKLLWKSTSSISNLPGYGSPLAINQINNITGTIQFRNDTNPYLNPAPAQDTVVATAKVTIYVEFYNSLV